MRETGQALIPPTMSREPLWRASRAGAGRADDRFFAAVTLTRYALTDEAECARAGWCQRAASPRGSV